MTDMTWKQNKKTQKEKLCLDNKTRTAEWIADGMTWEQVSPGPGCFSFDHPCIILHFVGVIYAFCLLACPLCTIYVYLHLLSLYMSMVCLMNYDYYSYSSHGWLFCVFFSLSTSSFLLTEAAQKLVICFCLGTALLMFTWLTWFDLVSKEMNWKSHDYSIHNRVFLFASVKWKPNMLIPFKTWR